MVVNNRLGYLFVFLGMSMALYAQRKTEVIRYGDLDQWVVRKITESAIIGKETKTLRIRLSEIDLLSRKLRLGAVLT